MRKRTAQYFLIGFLFLSTNLLYFFAQRDTRAFEERPLPDDGSAAQLLKTDSTHFPAN
ncbi:MAG: hypothetical protein ACK4E0_09190 [Chitinophagaceae bacterium]